MKKLLLLICTFLFLAAAAYAQEVPTVTEITKQSNEKLTEEYQDKPMIVKGIITYTGPDVYGLPSFNLHETADTEGEYILCVLPYSDYFKLGDLKIGQEVTVSGSFRSKHKDGFIVLKQSTVIE